VLIYEFLIIWVIALTNPIKTICLVGVIVGISLLFDGIMLIVLSKGATKE